MATMYEFLSARPKSGQPGKLKSEMVDWEENTVEARDYVIPVRGNNRNTVTRLHKLDITTGDEHDQSHNKGTHRITVWDITTVMTLSFGLHKFFLWILFTICSNFIFRLTTNSFNYYPFWLEKSPQNSIPFYISKKKSHYNVFLSVRQTHKCTQICVQTGCKKTKRSLSDSSNQQGSTALVTQMVTHKHRSRTFTMETRSVSDGELEQVVVKDIDDAKSIGSSCLRPETNTSQLI